jgi:dUTP pyrophosphatase
MKIYKLNPKATIPAYATEGSACFDLKACFDLGDRIRAYNPLNRELFIPTKNVTTHGLSVQIPPQYRVLIPTGLIFNLPKNTVMKIYARSGIALKEGLALANGVAVIDSDYVEETFVMVINNSDNVVVVADGDRIAQAALEDAKKLVLEETPNRPSRKTDRAGGLGSTGVQ